MRLCKTRFDGRPSWEPLLRVRVFGLLFRPDSCEPLRSPISNLRSPPIPLGSPPTIQSIDVTVSMLMAHGDPRSPISDLEMLIGLPADGFRLVLAQVFGLEPI